MVTVKDKRTPGFKFAISGLIHTVKSETNFRIHLIIASIVAILGFYFKISGVEWLFIVLAIGIVLMAELFNTAIEILVDMVSPDFNSKAGHIKDIAAAAVLIVVIAAVITGLIIFIPYVL